MTKNEMAETVLLGLGSIYLDDVLVLLVKLVSRYGPREQRRVLARLRLARRVCRHRIEARRALLRARRAARAAHE
jgi:hypothetical protein